MSTEPGSFREPIKRERPRIQPKKLTPALNDPLEFKKNKCTDYARFICSVRESIECEIHIDKHYHIRNGQRDGIEPEVVEALVKKSMKYLFAFAAMVRSFKFINYDGQTEPPTRVILKDGIEENTLNVAAEVHFLAVNKYQITIKTAMCVVDFRIENGQFAITFEDGCVSLMRLNNKDLQLICEL